MIAEQIMEREKQLHEGEVAVIQTKTLADQLGRLAVVTQRYEREGYLADVETIPMNDTGYEAQDILQGGVPLLSHILSPEQLARFTKSGAVFQFEEDGPKYYIDRYHWASVGFVAITKKDGILQYIGSARLILANKGTELPIQHADEVEIDPEYANIVTNAPAEFSQFAVSRGTPSNVSVALLRSAYTYSKEKAIPYWIATTDARVVKLLNGSYFHFNLPAMGKTVYYLGSESTPVLIDLKKSIENATQFPSSKPIAQFIDGDYPAGFEWYVD